MIYVYNHIYIYIPNDSHTLVGYNLTVVPGRRLFAFIAISSPCSLGWKWWIMVDQMCFGHIFGQPTRARINNRNKANKVKQVDIY